MERQVRPAGRMGDDAMQHVTAQSGKGDPHTSQLIGLMVRRPGFLINEVWLLLTSRWKARRCTVVGPRLRVRGRLLVSNGGEIHLGERVRIRASHVPVELGAAVGGRLEIGAGTFINSGVSICAQEAVTIGRNCAIGNYTLIMDSDFHVVGEHASLPSASPVTLGDNVWIGARTTILKGVHIGEGSVVGAGAVVTRDVAPFTVVGGVPARFMRDVRRSVATPLHAPEPPASCTPPHLCRR